MSDFGKKEATIYVKYDEHANMHSLPFRYGFYFKANQKLGIFECKDWLNETNNEGQKTIRVTANFKDHSGKTWAGLFTLIDNKQQQLLAILAATDAGQFERAALLKRNFQQEW